MIVDTAGSVERRICLDLQLKPIDGDQFEFRGGFWNELRAVYGDEAIEGATQWVRDYLLNQDAAWEKRCEKLLLAAS